LERGKKKKAERKEGRKKNKENKKPKRKKKNQMNKKKKLSKNLFNANITPSLLLEQLLSHMEPTSR
jgi:hypothetical protein